MTSTGPLQKAVYSLTRRSQCPLAQRRTDKTMARIISFALALMLVACQSPARFAEARTLKKPVVHEQTQPKEEQKPKKIRVWRIKPKYH